MVQERRRGKEKGQQRLPVRLSSSRTLHWSLGDARKLRRCTIFDAAISTSAPSCSTSQLSSSSSVSPSFSMQNRRTQDRKRGQGKRRQRDWTRGEKFGAYASDVYASNAGKKTLVGMMCPSFYKKGRGGPEQQGVSNHGNRILPCHSLRVLARHHGYNATLHTRG